MAMFHAVAMFFVVALEKHHPSVVKCADSITDTCIHYND